MPDTKMPGNDPLLRTGEQEATPPASTRAAYDLLLPRILATEGSTHINVDCMYVSMLVRAQVKAIEALREKMVETLRDFKPSLLDELDGMARALQHAHGLYLQATKAPAALQSLMERGTDVRDLLHGEALTLARRGLINADSYREVKRNTGYRALILDLQILVQTFRERWAEIKDRTGVKGEELDAAEALIDTLTDAVIIKDYSPAAQAQATRVREKAFLLLARTYGEVRDAVIYVRRAEGDADTIAPSLYGNRNTGRRSQSQEEAAEGDAAEQGARSAEAKENKEPGAPVPAASNLNDELAESVQFKRAAGEG
jgi:hypothetical protein